MNKFTNQFSLTKTIKMELVPENENAKLLKKDSLTMQKSVNKANAYKKAKEVLDEYYRIQINEKLNSFSLENEKVVSCFNEFIKKRANKEYVLPKTYENNISILRKSIATLLSDIKKIEYKPLINKQKGKETSKILDFIEKEFFSGKITEAMCNERKNAISHFEGFVGYFDGYKENRNNMFSDKAEITSIANRLINDNMFFYFENCFRIEKIKQINTDLYNNLRKILGAYSIPENYVNLLTQEKIKTYNSLIGHKQNDKFVKGCNQLINEAKQKDPEQKKHYQLLLTLQNLILFRETNEIQEIDVFENDKEMLENISSFINNNLQTYINNCKDFFSNEFDFSSCFILSNKISKLSQILFESEKESYALLKRKLIEKEKIIGNYLSIDEIVENCEINVLEVLKTKLNKILEELNSNILDIKSILELSELSLERNPPNKDKKEDKGGDGFQQICKIKIFFDSLIDLNRFFIIFSPNLDGKNILTEKVDFDFYGLLEDILNFDMSIYYKVKNYLSKKPYTNDKIRIYFDNNAQFLNGFVESKTDNSDNGTQYGGYLFRKKNKIGEYDYYLGCSTNAFLFREDKVNTIPDNDKSDFERFYYYQPKLKTIYNSYKNEQNEGYDVDKQKLKDCIKNIIQNNESTFEYTQEETPTAYLSRLEKENNSLYNVVIKDKDFVSLQNSIISNLKETFRKYEKKVPILNEILNKNYSLLKEFIDSCSVIEQSKSVYYAPVSKTEFNKIISGNLDSKTKPFYLFKIQNKDLKDKSERKNKNGTDNLHTMYFKALMSENQKSFDIGKGMIFFRENNYSARKITHAENQPIKNKTPNYHKKESIFPYPIVKDERYFSDKFFLHLSFSINYTKKDLNLKELNSSVNKYIYENKDKVNIIGIDRGERNLIYITIINQNGDILYQNTMNNISYSINSNDSSTIVEKDYHQILDNRVKEREIAQKNWGVINNIKELKDGYLSQVIHEISMLMIRYNAVIVMENLNNNFKRSRICIDNQIYQKFEKALLDKLSYLVVKKDEIIHGEKIDAIPATQGLQLSVPMSSFREIKDQNGFCFYVWPQYTSKICPKTGFVSLFDTREKTISEAKSFFNKFEKIYFDGTDFYFVVSNYSQFITDKKNKTPFSKFIITSKGDRIINEKIDGVWESKTLNTSLEIKKLFRENNIDCNGDIKKEIVDKTHSSGFYFELMKYFRNLVQIRYSKTNDATVDYILSPIADENGNNIFDSRKCIKDFPIDADANGAYHIALKGLMALKTLTPDGKIKISNSNTDWFKFIYDFVQEKKYKD